MADKIRENKLRRMAERQGLGFYKMRTRDPKALTYGLYIVTRGGPPPREPWTDDDRITQYGVELLNTKALDDIERFLN